MEEKVVLHGMWGSTYSKRVELALRTKGIPYDYVEEDLGNKSHLLLHYNPIHKKVPILVHNGRPIVESTIIIEYINDTWQNAPHLLPNESLERAKVRFWASFIEQQVFEGMKQVMVIEGEAQEKAAKEVIEKLKILEEGMKKEGFPLINRENLGLLDIIMSAVLCPYKAQEQVLGVKFLDREINPLVFKWVTSLNKHPLVIELLPTHQQLVEVLMFLRQNFIVKY